LYEIVAAGERGVGDDGERKGGKTCHTYIPLKQGTGPNYVGIMKPLRVVIVIGADQSIDISTAKTFG
jgi:hypothetical protein